MTLGENALQIAISQLGVEESPKGSNAGEAVEKYLKSVGLGKGYAWCMAFAYYCYKSASEKMNVLNPLYKTAGVLKQWNESEEFRSDTPEPGCLFIMDYGKGLGHTGIVEKVLSGGRIQTIEGNTNDDGSREGYEVCRRTRKISSCKGFLIFK